MIGKSIYIFSQISSMESFFPHQIDVQADRSQAVGLTSLIRPDLVDPYYDPDQMLKKMDNHADDSIGAVIKKMECVNENPVPSAPSNLHPDPKESDLFAGIISSANDIKPVEPVFPDDKEDEKIVMLEKIDMLKEVLEENCINLSRVPSVDMKSEYKQIKHVLRVLQIKNDRDKLSVFAEEGILLSTALLEFMCDGEKEYLGFKPDLVGWSDTVKMKLRRLKFETSSIVGELVQDTSIHPGMRLLIELVPSMILYGRNQSIKRQRKENALSDARMHQAMSSK